MCMLFTVQGSNQATQAVAKHAKTMKGYSIVLCSAIIHKGHCQCIVPESNY